MTPPTPEPRIRLNKLVRAPRKRVYEAWLDPAQVKQWWFPGPGMTVPSVSMDAVVGGRYRIEMSDGARSHIAVGEYVELVPFERIVFTWSWETQPGFAADSRVIVVFLETATEEGPATEILFTHEGLTTPAERSDHTSGWVGALRALGFHCRGVNAHEAINGKAARA